MILWSIGQTPRPRSGQDASAHCCKHCLLSSVRSACRAHPFRLKPCTYISAIPGGHTQTGRQRHIWTTLLKVEAHTASIDTIRADLVYTVERKMVRSRHLAARAGAPQAGRVCPPGQSLRLISVSAETYSMYTSRGWAGENACLFAQGRCELGEGVLQAQLADEGEDGGDARHAHHERKVALDGLAHARVPHFHRHHYACMVARLNHQYIPSWWHSCLQEGHPPGWRYAYHMHGMKRICSLEKWQVRAASTSIMASR